MRWPLLYVAQHVADARLHGEVGGVSVEHGLQHRDHGGTPIESAGQERELRAIGGRLGLTAFDLIGELGESPAEYASRISVLRSAHAAAEPVNNFETVFGRIDPTENPGTSRIFVTSERVAKARGARGALDR